MRLAVPAPYLVAAIPLASGVLVGAASTWRSVRAMRRGEPAAIAAPGAVAWEQEPVPLGEQSVVQGGFIGVHSAGVLAMAVLFAWDRTLRAHGVGVGAAAAPPLSEWIAWTAFLLTSILGGIAAGFPFAYSRAGAATVRVDANGVTWGRHFRAWPAFGRVAGDASTRTIRLFSTVSHDVERMVLRPRDVATFEAALGVARAALPSSPPAGRGASPRSLIGLALAADVVAIALGVAVAGTAWGWAYYLPAALALVSAAPAMLARYGLD